MENHSNIFYTILMNSINQSWNQLKIIPLHILGEKEFSMFGFLSSRFWALLSGCCQILAGHNTDFRRKTFLKQLPASKKSLPWSRLTNLLHFTSQRSAQRSLWPTATCGLVQLQKTSMKSWLCCATYLEGDTAVAFGSFQEDPTLVFLSPLVLGRKQRKKKVTKH